MHVSVSDMLKICPLLTSMRLFPGKVGYSQSFENCFGSNEKVNLGGNMLKQFTCTCISASDLYCYIVDTL